MFLVYYLIDSKIFIYPGFSFLNFRKKLLLLLLPISPWENEAWLLKCFWKNWIILHVEFLWVEFSKMYAGESSLFKMCLVFFFFFFNDSHLAPVILLATDVHSTLSKCHIKIQCLATCSLVLLFWIIHSEVAGTSDRRCGSSSLYDCGAQSCGRSEGNMQLPLKPRNIFFWCTARCCVWRPQHISFTPCSSSPRHILNILHKT